MSNEDDLNPNISPNNDSSILYSGNTDQTQNITASLFPNPSFKENNGILPEQNNELSNLLQNGANNTQINDSYNFGNNIESTNNDYNVASSLFNTQQEPNLMQQSQQQLQQQDFYQQQNTNYQQYHQQYYSTPINQSEQYEISNQQQFQNVTQYGVFIPTQQIQQLTQSSQVQQQIQLPNQLLPNQQTTQSPVPIQQQIQPPSQIQQQIQQPNQSLPIQQQIQPPPPIQQQQYNYSYPSTQNLQEQVALQNYSSAPVQMNIPPPPPKGPSPTYFTPLTPSNKSNQLQSQIQQPYSPKRVFVPGSLNQLSSGASPQQQSPSTSPYQASQMQQRKPIQVTVPPSTTPPQSQAQSAMQRSPQSSPRSPGTTKRGPVFVAPYIPGQQSPAKVTIPTQQTNETESVKFRPPPPFQQSAKVSQKSIQPPPPNSHVPVQQPQKDESAAQFQKPPPMIIAAPPTAVTPSAKPSYQPPPQISIPPSSSSKGGIYIPGQGRINQNSDEAEANKAEAVTQPQQFAPPPPVPSTSTVSQPQQFNPPPPVPSTSTVTQPQQFNPPPPVPSTSTVSQPQQFAPPPPVPSTSTVTQFTPPPSLPTASSVSQPPKLPQFAQPPPAPYIPGQSTSSISLTRQPYVPGMKPQSEDETDTKNSSDQEIKKPPTFFTPQESSSSTSSSFMRPPPMPVPLPVGIPITHESIESEPQKKTRKRKKKAAPFEESQGENKKSFEPSPVPFFMTPEAVAERGGSLPHSQTTGNVSIADKSEYEYEYEYDNEEGFKHSISEPNSVVPISQFTGVYEPFFTKKKPIVALGFNGLVLTRGKENENEIDNDNAKKNCSFVSISKINDKSSLTQLGTFKKDEFVANELSISKDDNQKLLWASIRIFLSQSSREYSTSEEVSSNSVLREFRANLKKEGTVESELIKILSSPSETDIIEEEEEVSDSNETEKTSSKSDEEKVKLLNEVQKRIVDSGEESALEFALENEMWPVALIISSSLSPEMSQKVVSKYIETELENDNHHFDQLSGALSIISGIGFDDTNIDLFESSKWKQQLKEILIHLTPMSQKTSLIKMASILESNKLNCASLACIILSNLHLASQIAFLNSSKNDKAKNKEAINCFDDFDLFITSIIKKAPASSMILQVAKILADEKENQSKNDERKLNLNLALLHSAFLADFGHDSECKKELESLTESDYKFAKRLLDNLNNLTEKVTEESIKVVPLRKEDLPPPSQPKKSESESSASNFFVPMAAFIPGLAPGNITPTTPATPTTNNNSIQQQQNKPLFFNPNSSTTQNQPSFSIPSQPNLITQQNNKPSFYTTTPNSHRPSAISKYPIGNDYVDSISNEDRSDNNNNGYNNEPQRSAETVTKKSSEPQLSTTSGETPQSKEKSQPQPENQQPKRGWFSRVFSKLNPFGSNSKVVDLSEHDNGEMVWNGHRYVMKGHENEESSLPPPPPISKVKSSPFPISESQKESGQLPPPSGTAPLSSPPPQSEEVPPPPPGPMTAPPIGAVAPIGRTRVSKRYVANF